MGVRSFAPTSDVQSCDVLAVCAGRNVGYWDHRVLAARNLRWTASTHNMIPHAVFVPDKPLLVAC